MKRLAYMYREGDVSRTMKDYRRKVDNVQVESVMTATGLSEHVLSCGVS